MKCVSSHIEASRSRVHPDISVHMYMTGPAANEAIPTIVFCSRHKELRGAALFAVQRSGVMDRLDEIFKDSSFNYTIPEIRLAQWAAPAPMLLATGDANIAALLAASNSGDRFVLTDPTDDAVGRRLLIPGLDPKGATGGPILHIAGRVFQLTVRHLFWERGDDDPPVPETPETTATLDDLEFVDINNLNNYFDSNEMTGLQELDPGPVLPSAALASEEQSTGISVPSKLDRVGKLAEPESDLDYALIELCEKYRDGTNKLPLSADSSRTWITITKEWEISPEVSRDYGVITVTASSGFLAGNLSPIPSYIRFPRSGQFEKVYSVKFNDDLVRGDCGAAVVDRDNGHFYGHVVAGIPGTGQAYILPAKRVICDIRERLGQHVKFGPELHAPPEENNAPLVDLFKYAGKKPAPRVVIDAKQKVDFASFKYFNELKGVEFGSPMFIRGLRRLDLTGESSLDDAMTSSRVPGFPSRGGIESSEYHHPSIAQRFGAFVRGREVFDEDQASAGNVGKG